MNIEVGKYYKTRAGRKAFVGYRHPPEAHEIQPLVGHVHCMNGELVASCWREDGSWTHKGTVEDADDLIAEWVEPVIVEQLHSLIRDANGDFATVFGLDPRAIGTSVLRIVEGQFVSPSEKR